MHAFSVNMCIVILTHWAIQLVLLKGKPPSGSESTRRQITVWRLLEELREIDALLALLNGSVDNGFAVVTCERVV